MNNAATVTTNLDPDTARRLLAIKADRSTPWTEAADRISLVDSLAREVRLSGATVSMQEGVA